MKKVTKDSSKSKSLKSYSKKSYIEEKSYTEQGDKLFIVESPGKIKKIKSILGKGWIVKASLGHIRKLSNKGDYQLGFQVSSDKVICEYIPISEQSEEIIRSLRKLSRSVKEVYIASDPDREGETIAWHLVEELGLRNYRRVVYQEITASAIQKALSQSRRLDENLVAAGRCRDCLDKLIGYRFSQKVWEIGAKSVGRVQSATLHFLCEREKAIREFVSVPYWVLWSHYENGVKARYIGTHLGSADPVETEEGESDQRGIFYKESDAIAVRDAALGLSHQVKSIEKKKTVKNPPLAFTTSTLQQAASQHLKYSPEKTMMIAQKLYEAGHITYMRTDSTELSQEFRSSLLSYLSQNHPDIVAEREYKAKNRSDAQGAHEAIRPTHLNPHPDIDPEWIPLYELIWNRTLATHCCPAEIEKQKIIIQSGSFYWEIRGQRVLRQGYGQFWNDLPNDNILPSFEEGMNLPLKTIEVKSAKTQPPPRYTEAKTIQQMEKLGIGRPSTYATTVKTLKEREYISLKNQQIFVTDLGMKVDEYMIRLFPEIVNPKFTASMEEALDLISSGKKDWEKYIFELNNYVDSLLKNA